MPEKNTRVLILGISWPPETFIKGLIRGLLSKGIRVTVASRKRPDSEWMCLAGFNWLPVFLAPVFVSWFKKRWNVFYFPWNSSAIRYLKLLESGIPAVISCRGSQVNIAPHNPERADIRGGLAGTFEKAFRVHCVSRAILKEAVLYGLDPARAEVIYPAVDPVFFSPPAERRGKQMPLKIISTGSLNWRKGYEYGLAALRLLADWKIPFEFDLIGEGPDRQRVFYTVKDLELESFVRLRGNLPPSGVRDLLRQADVFLLSSVSEGLSNAALEAMACGLPVVTTDSGGMSEAVTDGVEGFVTPVYSQAGMAEALKKLAEDRSLCEKMGQAARVRVLRDFKLENQIQKMAEIFHQAAAGRS